MGGDEAWGVMGPMVQGLVGHGEDFGSFAPSEVGAMDGSEH